jgi:hypothetical protein
MSRNLIKAGHDLMVYNRTRSRADELQHLGAKVANSASEAAAGAEALITMLADDGAVQDVIFEPGRAIESLPAEAVHISISPSALPCLAGWRRRMRRNISITLRRLFSADRMLPPRRNYLSWQPGQVNKSRSVETSFRQWDKKLSSSMKTRLRPT